MIEVRVELSRDADEIVEAYDERRDDDTKPDGDLSRGGRFREERERDADAVEAC